MRMSMVAWVIAVLLIIGLYVGGPILGLNSAAPAILGMPPLYFWFVLVPLLSPVILGIVYLIDLAENPQANSEAVQVTE